MPLWFVSVCLCGDRLHVVVRCTCTGFHNRWNRTVAVRHPNVWIFIRKLKDEERQCRRVIHAAERGDAPPRAKGLSDDCNCALNVCKTTTTMGAGTWTATGELSHTSCTTLVEIESVTEFLHECYHVFRTFEESVMSDMLHFLELIERLKPK